MKYLCLAVAAVAVAVSCIFTPKFLKEQRNGKTKISLLYKMICATMFVVAGLVCAAFSSNGSQFALFMLIGLVLSWIGDFLLGFPTKSHIPFAVGFCFFMGAHIAYIVNYTIAMKKLIHNAAVFTWADLLAIVVLIFIGFTILILKYKFKITNISMIPMLLYSVVLMTMFERAVLFAVRLFTAGGSIPGGIVCLVGATLFTLSDFVMGPLCFGRDEDRKNVKLKDFNIWTYFLGQLFLASSLMFIVL